jgi:hypothetical protein
MVGSRSVNTPSNIATDGKPIKRLAKLTQEERAVLRANNGCFKCRKVNAGHVTKDCPEVFPGFKNQRPLTNADHAKARSNNQKSVAAVIGESNDSQNQASTSAGTPFAHPEVVGSSVYQIVAVLPPPNESSVLGSQGVNLDDSVSPPPFSHPSPFPTPWKPSYPY